MSEAGPRQARVRWQALDDFVVSFSESAQAGAGSRSRRRGHPSREGVLVSTTRPSLTRRLPRRSRAAVSVGPAERPDRAGRSWQGTSEIGRHARTWLTRLRTGGTARESLRSRLSYQYRAVSERGEERVSAQDALLGLWHGRSWRFAVKRSSTGSRGQSVTGPQGCGARGARDRESDSAVGARVVSRLQKSERRIFFDGAVRRGATRDEPGTAE
jgi:hypothetical protein